MYQSSLEYSKSFPLWEKTITATSASHKTEISLAFFSNPVLLLEKVTCLLILFSMRFNWTLPLPMFDFLLLFYVFSFLSFFFFSLSFLPLICSSENKPKQANFLSENPPKKKPQYLKTETQLRAKEKEKKKD